jgi:glycosyltransferase involved in cell wall biosynthesis
LLFLAPIAPRATGNGLAQRCHAFLRALSPLFQIHLHIVPLADPNAKLAKGEGLHEFVKDLVIHPSPPLEPAYVALQEITNPLIKAAKIAAYPKPLLCRFAGASTQERIATRLPADLGCAHVSRLYLAPFLPRQARAGCWRTLDLDDYESATHRRFADLHRKAGRQALADVEVHETRRYERMEAEWLPKFDRVSLANDRERLAVAARLENEATFIHIPNGAPPSATRLDASRSQSREVVLLFVGTLGYLPNEDAVHQLCSEILPALRPALAPTSVKLVIAGMAPSSAVRKMARQAGARLVADVADLRPIYGSADIVVVPVRAGGGSRIKILEAFAYGRPVIASPEAAEGLDVAHDRELLIATEPTAFVSECMRLARDLALWEQLVQAGRHLLDKQHAPAIIDRSIRAMMAPALTGST